MSAVYPSSRCMTFHHHIIYTDKLFLLIVKCYMEQLIPNANMTDYNLMMTDSKTLHCESRLYGK